MRSIKLVLIFGILFYSCGGSSKGIKQGRNSNVITAEEIEQSSVTKTARNAYDVIKYLRPQFLKVRGTTSTRSTGSTTPVVYFDNIRFGSINELQNIMVQQIGKIQYLNPGDATFRFGGDHTGGAILITSR